MSISLIIPVFNTSKSSFSNCLQSIVSAIKYCKPNYNFEVIIVDDGSIINYNDLLFSVEKDLRINYIKLVNNKGRSHARNVGIDNSSSLYITFLDSDDELVIDYFFKTNKYYNIITKNVITSFGYYINNIPILRPISFRNFKPIKFINYHFFCTNSIFIVREILIENKFDEYISVGEDLKLWNHLINQFNGIHLNLPISIYKYDFKTYNTSKGPRLVLIFAKKLKYYLKFRYYGLLFKTKIITKIL